MRHNLRSKNFALLTLTKAQEPIPSASSVHQNAPSQDITPRIWLCSTEEWTWASQTLSWYSTTEQHDSSCPHSWQSLRKQPALHTSRPGCHLLTAIWPTCVAYNSTHSGLGQGKVQTTHSLWAIGEKGRLSFQRSTCTVYIDTKDKLGRNRSLHSSSLDPRLSNF